MGRKSNYSESYKREAVAKAQASGNELSARVCQLERQLAMRERHAPRYSTTSRCSTTVSGCIPALAMPPRSAAPLEQLLL